MYSDAIIDSAKAFLSAHDNLSLMKWKHETVQNKIRWIEYLKPKDKQSEFFDACIYLLQNP